MAKKKPKKKSPELRVVFDTNVLFTGSAHYLINGRVKDFIAGAAGHTDLNLLWYLPDVVISERRYQMRLAAASLFPSIEKMERLLGHQLAITPEIVNDRIDRTIEEQLAAHDISKLSLDLDAIDWSDLIRRSVERLPPFDAGDNEKGFRDAVICEAFCQLVDGVPAQVTELLVHAFIPETS